MWKRAMIAAAVLFLVGAAAYASFYIAPEEKTMRVLQRIFYFHAATAWAGETAFGICFLANLAYVWLRKEKWDWLAVSAAEVGLACITVVLITGPIWAKPAWGIYWTWDARLTSTFVLWLLYISYLLLRTMIEEPDRRALLSALLSMSLSCLARFAGGVLSIQLRSSWEAPAPGWIPPCAKCFSSACSRCMP
jgi:heme exporter protein C